MVAASARRVFGDGIGLIGSVFLDKGRIITILLVRVLSLDLYSRPRIPGSAIEGYSLMTFANSPPQHIMSQRFCENDGAEVDHYRAGGVLLVGALAGHLEGDIVGRDALDLDGAGRDMVEVLVEQLELELFALAVCISQLGLCFCS